ncbi:type II secretion system protein [Shewanella sp. S1-49-MNA-CIBAN-0167]|uniref:type II secretion system protein n=1 Tax=Shewanella sp. S1-49-MNA-CIBAN-0167 TaxID=3140468 RepID=UPI0033323207
MQKQQGFTLIELVVVIIILGILAVTAAPKFINLQGDARASALQGLKGAIQGANTLVYSKAALAGEEQTTATTLDIAGTTAPEDDVAIAYGYIAATESALEAGLDVATADWIFEDVDAADASTTPVTPATLAGLKIQQAGAPSTCSFTYTQATATSTPKFSAMPDADAC